MTLNNIKTMKKDNGFTIVELLIVIVVIAILAAIIIVAYQGVTSRANTSKAQTNAVSVQKKAEAYNADNSASGGNGVYPATTVAFIAVAAGSLGSLPAGVTIVPSGTALTTTNGATTVQYVSCSATSGGAATGYYVAYYDFTQSTKVYITGGANITPGATNITAPTCSNPSTT